jgi:hypothetical protein
MNSHFVYNRDLGGDTWDNGILYNSIWNKMTFTNGLVKKALGNAIKTPQPRHGMVNC